jgi:hypothetical protein
MTLLDLIKSTGLTDPQEIVEVIKAKGLTHRPINRADLIHLLNMRGMLRKIVSNNTSEKWEGTVLNMQDAIMDDGTETQKNGIRLWFSHVTNVSNNQWDTTKEEFARPFREMVLTFADIPTMPTREDFEAVLALGGWWKYENLTAQQVALEIELEEKRVVIESARTQVNSRTTAINAWLDAIDMSLSIEEIESYISDLLSSDDGNPSGGGE